MVNCALCGQRAATDICPACHAAVPWIEHACTCCGIPLPYPALCALCQLKPPLFFRCISPLAYAAPISHLLGAFKYQHQLHYGRLLSCLLIERLRGSGELAVDAIVPTPLHWRRRWMRGFNQAEIIADELSRALSIPLQARWLRRIRATPRQQELSAEQRRKNLHGAFVATRSLTGLRIALVDDVVTTGATTSEISQVLLAAGATAVQVWCLARTP
jgi:ComF family protein